MEPLRQLELIGWVLRAEPEDPRIERGEVGCQIAETARVWRTSSRARDQVSVGYERRRVRLTGAWVCEHHGTARNRGEVDALTRRCLQWHRWHPCAREMLRAPIVLRNGQVGRQVQE